MYKVNAITYRAGNVNILTLCWPPDEEVLMFLFLTADMEK